MKQRNKNVIFVLFSFLVVSCLILAGISVAERSAVGFILSLVAAVGIIGLGFTLKRKWRKESE